MSVKFIYLFRLKNVYWDHEELKLVRVFCDSKMLSSTPAHNPYLHNLFMDFPLEEGLTKRS